jgi:hypothetical protein
MAKSSSNSFSKVSRLTGIDYKSLKKIKSLDINLKNLHPLKVAKLAKLVMNKDCQLTFLKMHRDDLNQKLVDAYLSLYTQPDVNPAKETKLSDHFEFEIFTLCSNKSGVSTKQISELNGLNGIHALERLVAKDLIQLKDERYFVKEQGFQYYDRENLKKQVTQFSKKIKLKKRANLKNYLMFTHESLNNKGVDELEKLSLDYHNKVLDIFHDDLYKGDNHYFHFMGYDSNIDKDYTQNRRLQ